MADTFNIGKDGRKYWRRNFTVELPDGETKYDYVQEDVTKEPKQWQKNGKLPTAVRHRLDRKENQKRFKLCSDSPVTDAKRTVAQTCIDFLNEMKTPISIGNGEKRAPLRPNTIYEYDLYFRNFVIKKLGHIRIAKLSSSQIFKFYQQVQADDVTPSMMQNLKKCFQRFLNWATERHYIDANPTGADSLALIRTANRLSNEHKPKEKNITRKLVLRIFHLKSKYTRFEITTHFLPLQGLRIGEALGIRFEDIDLDANTITVGGQIQNVTLPKLVEVDYESGLTYMAPKTADGNRTFHLDHSTKELIEAIPVEERQGYVLKTKTGKPFNARNLARDFFYPLKAELVEEGLWDASEKLGPHKFRKFYASALKANEVDDMELKTNMGHKDISTTNKHYLLDIEDSDKRNFDVSDWLKEVETR
jgi:integrase